MADQAGSEELSAPGCQTGLADIQPFLTRPAFVILANDFGRELILVRAPVLSRTGADVADDFTPLGM
jgi:hypothetical protein